MPRLPEWDVLTVWPLETAKRNIIIAGCLGMAYTQLTLSAAAIDYVRELGGTGLHVGILNAIPVALLGFQFLAAIIANHLNYRRSLWVVCSLFQRAFLIPIVFGPIIWPELGDTTWIWIFLAAITCNQALQHFCAPLWLSWMGDYLPHYDLNTYWGHRQRWLQWSAAGSLCVAALLLSQADLGVRIGYPVLAAGAGILGLIDVLIFLKVDEPPVTKLPQPRLRTVLLAPFRHRGFRSFIGFMCFWHFATMIGAAFISLYLLDHVGMSLHAVLALWTWSWIGGALTASWLGRLSNHFGNKPLLVLCVICKTINMIALLAIPQDPTTAFYILVPVFMVDAALNAGFAIATNGFLLKNSPAENRTMFIASGTAMAGIVGGITATIVGAILSLNQGWSVSLGGHLFTGYHVCFAVSLLLRVAAIPIVSRIHEPTSHDTIQVVTSLIGVTPLRMIRYPAGLYRTMFVKPRTVRPKQTEARPEPTKTSPPN
ncbi:MFS transporter [Thalassoglobus sp. JC818]|uniref:MFS transporter n=1 Tax=Thalassoglobus sp. JC818 TaxID=3232136 RepID=UPI00345A262D